jgi:hypothetical protein
MNSRIMDGNGFNMNLSLFWLLIVKLSMRRDIHRTCLRIDENTVPWKSISKIKTLQSS